jgi:hypothetical protein
MSMSIDRQIAERIFGEPEPVIKQPDIGWSENGNWLRSYSHDANGYLGKWQPLPFSTDLDTALMAVEKYREWHNDVFILENDPERKARWKAWCGPVRARGDTAPKPSANYC